MRRSRPRLILLSILALFVFPMALAWMMFTGNISFTAQNTRNLGQLVIPTEFLDWSGVVRSNSESKNQPFGGYWVILYPLPSPCGEPCLEMATGLRQVHLATGKDFWRIKIAFLLDPAHPESLERQLRDIYPDFNLLSRPSRDFSSAIRRAAGNTGSPADVYLVDPDGHIMMTYNGNDSPNKLIKDLARLLTWSKQDKRS